MRICQNCLCKDNEIVCKACRNYYRRRLVNRIIFTILLLFSSVVVGIVLGFIITEIFMN